MTTTFGHARAARFLAAFGWLAVFAATLLCVQASAQEGGRDRGAMRVAQAVDAKRKVALVIGNNSYRSQPLDNPVRDAEAIGKMLRELGFDVQVVTNADRMASVRALQSFRERLRGAGVGLFYFAGHGVQMDGSNFLIPVDADLGSEDQIKYNTLRLDDVMAMLDQSGAGARIVILDACRNNPFERGRGGGGGLAAVNTAGQGTLISYATSPGRVARDGAPGGNGLFTTHLLEALRTPGLSIEQVFKLTRTQVARASNGAQVPWESTSLEGELVLRPGTVPDNARIVVAAAQPAADSAARSIQQPRSVGERFQDPQCERCPEMVVVDAGRFSMGAPDAEPGRQAMEGPVAAVTVPRRFAVARTETTFDQWEACLIANGCSHWPQDQGWGRGAQPVIGVSWEDARRYVAWLNRHTGRLDRDGKPTGPQYRLLTEAEWEYVARAGTRSARPWGEAIGQSQAQCRDCGVAASGRPSPAGSLPPNPWGVHEMLGNVWEWVEDCSNPTLAGRPADARARTEGDCSRRGVRGGAWSTSAKGVRSATRGFHPVSRRDAAIGFRVALDLPD
jgi:formylglycine-generating enzyme required for sulfatase activity